MSYRSAGRVDRHILAESQDGQITLDVQLEDETVWLTQAQMSRLFDTTKQNVSLHINNCFREGELDENSVVKESLTTGSDGKNYRTKCYALDVIISVGYRVKSQRGVEFRRWATNILRRYIVAGHVENEQRLKQLGQAAKIMARIPEELETRQILDIVQTYTRAFELLDSYDHHCVPGVKTRNAVYELSYNECMDVIGEFKSTQNGELFGVEKDDSFKSSIAAIAVCAFIALKLRAGRNFL